MITRRQTLGLVSTAAWGSVRTPAIERSVIFRGREAKVTYFQPRVCVVPGKDRPTLFMTVSPVTGDDVFWNLHASQSADLGRTWSTPSPLPGLKRVSHEDGITEEILVDACPEYHAKTGTLVILGDNVYYARDGKTQSRRAGHRWQQPVYLVRESDGRWQPPRRLEWDDRRASAMINCGNGQRVTLANGDVLVALSHAPEERYGDGPLGPRGSGSHAAFDRAVTVVRCSFDGAKMEVRQAGTEFRLPVRRGLIEPSLAWFRNRAYLTLRAEDGHGYSSASRDGLAWEPMKPWAWDDGSPLTMSTTQQHWLVFDERLFLVYTRRAAENEHVIRWRAPLFMAEVDPERLRIVRATEQIVFPMAPDARTGNFHSVAINREWAAVFSTEETSAALAWRGNTLLARLHRPAATL